MEWLAAWLRQIVGPPPSDPWYDDPKIREERVGQHERANSAQQILNDDWSRRNREAWRSRPHDA